MIKLENVTYRYREGDRPAIQNISLEIRPGESVCVMGSNGSGKSTFARLLAGLLQPNQGRVRISPPNPKPIPVGMIFQNPDNQMVAVTVEKELAFALENLGWQQDEMEQRINEALQTFNIAHLRRRLTTELSGGEKQRVALASVMIFHPDILVLDEPDSFLDQQGKASLRRELLAIKKEQPSMVQIHITQYPEVAAGYQRLIVFDRGEIAADNNPCTILADTILCERTGLRFAGAEKKRVGIPEGLFAKKKNGAVSVRGARMEAVRFAYADEDWVLRNLSAEVKAGQVVSVVGASGTGKSTMANLICGILRPTGGRIVYFDREGNTISAENVTGKVSGVFQQPERQFFLPTCREEISFGPKNLGLTLDENETGALFAMAGLEFDSFAERDPFTLSGGEKRRLAFAAVLSMSPDLVVFDEPTCGLDQEGVGRFILLAKALKEIGVGMVVISHDGHIVKSLADKVLYLRGEGGNLILSPKEFFTNAEFSRIVSPVGEIDDLPD